MKGITGFFMAWGSFCAIPCPYKKWEENARNHMLVALPLLGLFLGILWFGIWYGMDLLQIALPLQAAVLTAYPFLITGSIHLDGFMDCNDAILSRRPLEERQRILKDPHVGAFAVISACMVFLFFFAGQWTLLESASEAPWKMTVLIVIPMIARASAVTQVFNRQPLETSQYHDGFDRKKNRLFVWLSCFFWLAAVILGMIWIDCFGGVAFGSPEGNYFLSVLTLATGLSQCAGMYAEKQLGGMNGDIAGYCIVWCELIAILALLLV